MAASLLYYNEKHCFKPYVCDISIHLALGLWQKAFSKNSWDWEKIANVNIFLCTCAQLQTLFDDSLENINMNVNINFICAAVQGIVFLYCILYCHSLATLLYPFLFWFLFYMRKRLLKLMTKDTLLLFWKGLCFTWR